MTEGRLVQTKLRPPQLASTIIDRPRLRRRLEAHQGRVVLVSAPAGFGKTVTVVDWLTDRGAPVAWLSLDRFDNDLGRFRDHLAAAVAGLGGDAANKAGEILRQLVPSSRPDLPPDLLDALAELGSEPVLVLDELHDIESPDVMRVVEALVHAPAGCPRIVVMTREDPPFPTGRLQVSGVLLELRAHDLRFTAEETERFFELLLPGILTPGLIRRLDQRTEGWAAGLRLAAIALNDAEDPRALVKQFAGTNRLVTEYLLEEALSRQTPEIQQFLMETSALGRFSADSCVAITGDADAAGRLANVLRAGLFLVPLTSDGAWYRYHPLFAELLQFRLATRQPNRFDEIHRRASEWFEQDGDVSAALEHAAAMRDSGRLLRLLDAQVLGMLGRGEMGALRYWIDQVRDRRNTAYPMILCLEGWLRVVTDRAPDLESILGSIRAALVRAPDDYDPERRRQVEIHMEALAAYAARYGQRYEEAIQIDQEVRPRLAPNDPMTRGLLTYNTARVRMALADMTEASELLEQAFADHLRSGNLYLMLATLGRSAAVLAQTRGIEAARASVDAAVAFTEERRLEQHPANSIVLYNRGFVELLADELDEAERWFGSALEITPPQDYPEERVNALVGLCRVATARGVFDEAEALLLEAAALGQDRNADLGDSTLALERARLALAREVDGSRPRAPGLDLAARQDHWTAIRETEITLAIRQGLREGSPTGVTTLVEELERESRLRRRGPALCSALVARAVLLDPPEGWHPLGEALDLAAERGYVRPFLDLEAVAHDMLIVAEQRLPTPGARRQARLILDRFRHRSYGSEVSVPSTPAPPGLEDLLTEREVEVLSCLVEGMTNKTMARTLFVSLHTVKTHLKHIYAKLGVSSRTQAMARARELGINPRSRRQSSARAGSP